MTDLGKELKRALDRKGMKQKDLANLLGVSEPTITHWKKNEDTPDHQHWRKLREILGIDVQRILYYSKNQGDKNMNITPFEKITDFDTLSGAVEEILNNCRSFIDQSYEHSITEMLRCMMYLNIAFECYYHEKDHKDDDDPVDWSWLGANIREVVSAWKNDPWPMPMEQANFAPYKPVFLLPKQIRWMAQRVECHGWDDHGDHSHRSDYLNTIGAYGADYGYELTHILPETENTLTTMFKIALFRLVEILDNC